MRARRSPNGGERPLIGDNRTMVGGEGCLTGGKRPLLGDEGSAIGGERSPNGG